MLAMSGICRTRSVLARCYRDDVYCVWRGDWPVAAGLGRRSQAIFAKVTKAGKQGKWHFLATLKTISASSQYMCASEEKGMLTSMRFAEPCIRRVSIRLSCY